MHYEIVWSYNAPVNFAWILYVFFSNSLHIDILSNCQYTLHFDCNVTKFVYIEEKIIVITYVTHNLLFDLLEHMFNSYFVLGVYRNYPVHLSVSLVYRSHYWLYSGSIWPEDVHDWGKSWFKIVYYLTHSSSLTCS